MKIHLKVEYDILIDGDGARTTEQLITNFINKLSEVKKVSGDIEINYISDEEFDQLLEKGKEKK